MATRTGNADKQRLWRNIVLCAILLAAIGAALSHFNRERRFRNAWNAAIAEYNAGNYEGAIRIFAPLANDRSLSEERRREIQTHMEDARAHLAENLRP